MSGRAFLWLMSEQVKEKTALPHSLAGRPRTLHGVRRHSRFISHVNVLEKLQKEHASLLRVAS